jgi:uncharacterized protein
MKRPAQKLIILAMAFCSAVAWADATPLPRTLSTTGEGTATAAADTAAIDMQVSAENIAAGAAKHSVDQHINAALAAMTKLGIARKDMIATTLRLNPVYQYDNQQRTFSGYQATRDLRVNLRDLDLLDKVLEGATAAGINNIHSISLKSSDEDELRTKAFKAAIADSQRKAEVLATAYGAKLGNIVTISYNNPTPPVVMEGAPMMMKAMDQGAGGQYIHDEISVKDQIQVVFELLVPN